MDQKTDVENFEEWLKTNVHVKKESFLNLKDVLKKCELVQKDENDRVHSRKVMNYKSQIIDFIRKYHYKDVDSYFKDTTINGERCAGWTDLSLK
jgi:hypothetical protein